MNGFHYKADPKPKPSARLAPPAPSTKVLSSSSLSLLYVILVHSDLEVAKHIVDALDEAQHSFVIHVDGKYDNVFEGLREFAAKRNNIYLLDEGDRVRANWGGFSIVNATLNGIVNMLSTNLLLIAVSIRGRSTEVRVEPKHFV